MGADTPLSIADGFYVDESLPAAALQCANWYPQTLDGPALNPDVVRGCPGYEQIATTGTFEQVNRGATLFEDLPYFVNGGALWRLNRTLDSEGAPVWSLEELGDITGTGRVWMAENGTQLAVLVPGVVSTGYIFTTGPDTLATITDVNFKANGEPQALIFVDSYFVFTTDSKNYIISYPNDGTQYDALDVGSAEANTDATVAPMKYKNQLFIGGSVSAEAFQNLPNGADFPFVRTGLFLTKGVSAPFATIEADDKLIFVGREASEAVSIWAYAGQGGVQKIASMAVERELQALTPEELAQVFVYAYGESGASFVAFVLPSVTLVWNAVDGKWHQRLSRVLDAVGNTQTVRNRVNSVIRAYNLNIVGDSLDGRIGIMSREQYKEYGMPMVRYVDTMPFNNEVKPFTIPTLRLTVESGVGSEECLDPVISMSRSLDGKQFTMERSRRIGKIGENDLVVEWRRTGKVPRFCIFRFTLSDPVKPSMIKLTADIVPLA